MSSTGTDLFAGRYQLDRRLGAGGMSTVRLAVDTRLERKVAVKLLAEHLADDPGFIARFRREALSAARLVHPNVVQVFDFGSDESTGRQYIAMEFVDGPSCAELLREHGSLPAPEAVDILAQSCRGLHYAHRNGVVHRDVKPGNLLVNPDGVVKLADFGIAKAAEQSDITKVGSVVGTAAYLAPEQTRGEPATAASDVYALGVVAYQLLCGRLPYEGPSLTELARLQESGPPESPARLNRDVPPAIADAVLVALRPLPQERYADMAAMEHALRAAERGVRPPEADMDVTVPLSAQTDVTRALATDRTGATRPLAPERRRQLQPVDEGPPLREPAAPPGRRRAAPEPRRRRSPLRFLGLLVVALALGAIGLGVYQLESGGERQRVQIDPVDTGVDARQAVERLDQLIQDNVR